MAFPMIAAAGVALAGTVVNLWGQISGAQAQSEAAERNAHLKLIQADELLARQEINEGIMREKSGELQSRFVTAFASTGREGAGLGGVLRMKRDLEQNIELSRRDAEFKAHMLRSGADIDMALSSDAMSAAWLSGAGTVLTSAARTYSLLEKGDAQELYS